MYFSLILIILILFFWLVRFVLKPVTRGLSFLFCLVGVTALAVISLITFASHYQEINFPGLILLLIIGTTLVIFYAIRRLR